MYSDRDVHDLVDRIYTAAIDPSSWDDFLHAFARIGGATCAAITHHNEQRGEHLISGQVGVAPEIQRAYREYYGSRDEWFRAAARTPAGWIGTGQMLVPDSALTKSEFYNDHLRLNNDLLHLCLGVLRPDSSTLGSLSLLRPKKVGAFGESQLRLVRVLPPHVRRATQIHRKFVALEKRGSLLESTLDLLATAIVFVDESGRILLANRRAAVLLDRCDGLLSAGGKLRASSNWESSRLQQIIRGAALTANGKGLSSGGVIEISRKAPQPPLVVLATPIRLPASGLSPHRPAVAIFITDPRLEVRPNSDVLRHLYGVTPAEYALAALLADGYSLRQAADARRVTIATARSQLKAVFRKTNVSSQSQLVRLLLLMPPSVPRHKS
jgi:DNA-binding CsgD family transcriptional regulator